MRHTQLVKLIETLKYRHFKLHFKPNFIIFRNPRKLRGFSCDQNYQKLIRNKILMQILCIKYIFHQFGINLKFQNLELLMTSLGVDFDVIGGQTCVSFKIMS